MEADVEPRGLGSKPSRRLASAVGGIPSGSPEWSDKTAKASLSVRWEHKETPPDGGDWREHDMCLGKLDTRSFVD